MVSTLGGFFYLVAHLLCDGLGTVYGAVGVFGRSINGIKLQWGAPDVGNIMPCTRWYKNSAAFERDFAEGQVIARASHLYNALPAFDP